VSDTEAGGLQEGMDGCGEIKPLGFLCHFLVGGGCWQPSCLRHPLNLSLHTDAAKGGAQQAGKTAKDAANAIQQSGMMTVAVRLCARGWLRCSS